MKITQKLYPYSCLNSTVRMIDEVGLKREQVVFEIVESERLPEMAQELQLKTIAQGIEKVEELNWVKKLGADFVPGYYFARPASPPLLKVV